MYIVIIIALAIPLCWLGYRALLARRISRRIEVLGDLVREAQRALDHWAVRQYAKYLFAEAYWAYTEVLIAYNVAASITANRALSSQIAEAEELVRAAGLIALNDRSDSDKALGEFKRVFERWRDTGPQAYGNVTAEDHLKSAEACLQQADRLIQDCAFKAVPDKLREATQWILGAEALVRNVGQ